MLFVVSKIVGFVAVPSNAIGLLGILGLLLLMFKVRRVGIFALVFSSMLLIIFGLSPFPNVMLLLLSERFPAWQADGSDPEGIVVLGGGIESENAALRGSLEVNSAADRVFAMLDLARRYPKAKIVYSGGSGNLIQNSVPEAPFAGKLLDELGLSNGRLILESRSRTTAENATETRNLVTPQPGERWLLVTSAFHMPRSVASFRSVGFDVEAYPVDFRTKGWDDAFRPFARISYGLARADIAMHEWVGLVALRLTGRSSELLPSPKPIPTLATKSVLPRQP